MAVQPFLEDWVQQHREVSAEDLPVGWSHRSRDTSFARIFQLLQFTYDED